MLTIRVRQLPRTWAFAAFVSAMTWGLALQITTKASLLIATAFAARLLDVREFGTMMALQGVVVLVSAVLDVGTSTLCSRELAAGRLTYSTWRGARRLRLIIAPVVFACATVLMMSTSLSVVSIIALALACIAMNMSALVQGLLQGELQYRASAVSQGCGRIAYMAGVALATQTASETRVSAFDSIAVAFAAGEIISLLVGAQLVRTRRPVLGSARSKDQWIARSIPYWLNSIFNLTYNRADVAIVAALAGGLAAGVYAPASTIQNTLVVAPGLVAAALPTAGARIYAQDRGEEILERTYRATQRAALVVGLATAVVASLVMGDLVDVVVGSGYADSTLPATIMAWSAPLYGIQIAMIGYFVAAGRGRETTAIFATAFGAALLLNLVLTPRYGATGAALAAVLRDVPTLLIGWALIRRSRPPRGRPVTGQGRATRDGGVNTG